MPHFIIDCSENILKEISPEALINTVYTAAARSGLFHHDDVKVRLRPYQHFRLAQGKTSFMHVFGYIMKGRNEDEKADLAKNVAAQLALLLTNVSFLSVNISEFEMETYCNKSLLNPANKTNDRHFELY